VLEEAKGLDMVTAVPDSEFAETDEPKKQVREVRKIDRSKIKIMSSAVIQK
jgi:hypothetical protein